MSEQEQKAKNSKKSSKARSISTHVIENLDAVKGLDIETLSNRERSNLNLINYVNSKRRDYANQSFRTVHGHASFSMKNCVLRDVAKIMRHLKFPSIGETVYYCVTRTGELLPFSEFGQRLQTRRSLKRFAHLPIEYRPKPFKRGWPKGKPRKAKTSESFDSQSKSI